MLSVGELAIGSLPVLFQQWYRHLLEGVRFQGVVSFKIEQTDSGVFLGFTGNVGKNQFKKPMSESIDPQEWQNNLH